MVKDQHTTKLAFLDSRLRGNDGRGKRCRVNLPPPGNRLEVLRGDRQGQHSIRINDQYRLCFHWRDGQATAVAIADYHR